MGSLSSGVLALTLSLLGCDTGSQTSEPEVEPEQIVDMSITLDSALPDESVLDMTPNEVTREMLDPEGVSAGEVEALALREVRALNFGAFTTSPACALCHSNHAAATAMRNSEGEEIAPYNLWQGTMMANASRDPFWWAQVASEIALSPEDEREKIEGDCIRCHAPALARTAREQAGREGRLEDLKGGGHPAMVGIDGVACTTCHQILERGLGEPETFSGNFAVNELRVIFGPHRNPAVAPMQNHVDYTPTYAPHMTESKLCATCHTLVHDAEPSDLPITSGLEGREGWGFPEQTPYLEWRNSVFSNEMEPENGAVNEAAATCQDCHQPTYDEDGAIQTRIARSPPGGDFRINEREPFGQHVFVGGNTVLPQIIKRERAVLKPNGSDAALDMISALARAQLKSAASLSVTEVNRDDATLSFRVNAFSQVGHKLPTGFPSRRVWIKVEVTQAGRADAVVFTSGSHDARGRILDQDGEPLKSEWTYGAVEPHHQEITRSDQAQIYQAVMGDAAGQYTHAVTQARSWLKDNRLLPRGYRDDHPEAPYIRPIGVEGDPDFIGGQDQVQYRIDLSEDAGPLTLKVSLMYQTLDARFIRALFQTDRPEVAAFRTMYERADVSPVTMSEQLLEVP